jgi:hypothetical protein
MKKVIIVLVILAIIIAIGGYVFLSRGTGPLIQEKETLEECLANVPSEGEGFTDECYMDAAIAEEDESICSLIESNILENRDQCFSAVAIVKNDDSICNMIEIPRIKDLCFDKVKRFN